MIFLPHFSGAGTPTLNSHAKGAWIGMGLETDIVDLYKAILEGNSYECKLNMENMENAGISINSIRCIGCLLYTSILVLVVCG